MPSELPNMPRETHQTMLNGPRANTHMPIVGNEVASFRAAPRPWVTWRGVFVFLSGVVFIMCLYSCGGGQ